MSAWVRGLAGLVGLFALSGSGCTTTYTDADLDREERKQDAAAVAEEKADEEIDEEGGANKKEIQKQMDDVDDGSGADF